MFCNVIKWNTIIKVKQSLYGPGQALRAHEGGKVVSPSTGRLYPQEIFLVLISVGHAVAQLVEALRYKSEGRGFDSQWCDWNFSLT